MSNSYSHFSPDNYHVNYPRSQQAYGRRRLRFTSSYDNFYGRRHIRTSVDESYVSRYQGIIIPHNYQSVASVGDYSVRIIRITNLSNRDSVDRLLSPNYFHGRSTQNYFDQSTSEVIDDHYVTSDPFELITRFSDRHQEANYMEEKEEDSILEYFKTRTHCVAALKDGINNPTKTYEEICAICQAEFEHEETIGTLGCGHEYHTGCIKQWLLRKKNCPMCRASVLPFTST